MPILSDFSAILFDVDLTLTTRKREVTPETKHALHAVAEHGIQLGVCTGRTFVSLVKPILPHFPDGSLHVTAGGSQVVTKEGEVKWERVLSEQTLRELMEIATQTNDMFYVATIEQGYGSPSFIEKYQNLHNLIPHLLPVSELKSWQLPSFVCVNASPEFVQHVEKRDDITIKTSISTTNFVSYDITPKGMTKEEGLRAWCELQGLALEQVIGVGDSDNDVEFLNVVGHAVAMGNASPEIKNLADRVIDDTENNGLAVYLDALLKGSSV